MDIKDSTVLVLGGSGLVGLAVGRALMAHGPAAVVVSALGRTDAEEAAAELGRDAGGCRVEAEWGDLFFPVSLKDRARGEALQDASARAELLDDLYGDLTDDVIRSSTLGAMIERHRPDLIIDCVNTATAFAYQNVFASAKELRAEVSSGGVQRETVERHLAMLYLPQLIQHVQVALEAMRRAGTRFYLKVGTAGTGGMGLNVPFTHSEERPSRMLLAKSGVAGAHTLLLYLMARTPGAPAVKEIKPTAAISWKRIGYGEVRKRGGPIERYDAAPVALADAFGDGVETSFRDTGQTLDGVYLDAGENGLFSLAEFETLTALGLMEFITPEEIADNVVREIRGYPSGRDVIGALDAATSGPTYRAGVLRQAALEAMAELEDEHDVDAVAYEMLGPPRLSKLLFEGAILARIFDGLGQAAALDPAETARRAEALVREDDDLRTRALSIGIPILSADGATLLRGPTVKVGPERGQAPDDPRLADNGWIDLRESNWLRWRDRLERMAAEHDERPGPAQGSRYDAEPGEPGLALRPGRLAAWIFRHEDQGERIKR